MSIFSLLSGANLELGPMDVQFDSEKQTGGSGSDWTGILYASILRLDLLSRSVS